MAKQVWLCDCIINKMHCDLLDQTKEINILWYVYVVAICYLFSLESFSTDLSVSKIWQPLHTSNMYCVHDNAFSE